MKKFFVFHIKHLKYCRLETQEEELRPRPSYPAQLLALLLNIQQPLQSRFDKILRKLEVGGLEREEEEGEDQQCVRCGECVLPPLTGEQQIYPQ